MELNIFSVSVVLFFHSARVWQPFVDNNIQKRVTLQLFALFSYLVLLGFAVYGSTRSWVPGCTCYLAYEIYFDKQIRLYKIKDCYDIQIMRLKQKNEIIFSPFIREKFHTLHQEKKCFVSFFSFYI